MLAKNAHVYLSKKMSIILPMQREKYAKRKPAEALQGQKGMKQASVFY